MSDTSPIGLYIHVPFCKSKCPYCDFHSVPFDENAADVFSKAVIQELRTGTRLKDYVKEPLSADTIYFGGGTPSLLPALRFQEIVNAIRENIHLHDDSEITVECNPSSTSSELVEKLLSLGVNRISLGLQSAVNTERKALGRRGTAEDVSLAVSKLKAAGIHNFSFDVMLGVPGQTPGSLKDTLAFCAESGASHVSAYILKIEEGTPFFRLNDKLCLPDEDAVCDLYELCCRILEEYGFLQYEISNFAKPGFESRHNLKYWQLMPYIGLGPSAHSFYGGKRFYFPRDNALFLRGDAPVFDGEGGGFEELVMLSLRLKQGLDLSKIAALYGEAESRKIIEKALPLIEKRLLFIDGDRLCLTRQGFLLSNSVIGSLLF